MSKRARNGMEIAQSMEIDPVEVANEQTKTYDEYMKKYTDHMDKINTDLTSLNAGEIVVPKITTNECGQYVVQNQTDIIVGTTGYYRPYNALEAALLMLFKQRIYRSYLASTKVPYPTCHKPGPSCVQMPAYSKKMSFCRSNKRKYKYSRRTKCGM